jgi:hypothetical protein
MKLAWAATREPDELVAHPWANLCQHILESCLEICGEVYVVDVSQLREENIICMVCNAKQKVISVKIIHGPGAGKWTPIQIIDIDEGRFDVNQQPKHRDNRLQQTPCV